MSDESYIAHVETYLDAASETSKQYDDDGTRYHLSQAADAASEIKDDRTRRFAWSNVAKHAINVQYPELSQQLARKLIRLDRKLGQTSWVITDVLTYGSSLQLTRQHLEAEDVYRQAFDFALEIESWQHAAAASSNYAAAIAARGALKDAQDWLERSLKYLEREPDLDTEIRTRAMLIQVKHARGAPPAACFEEARSLLDEVKTKMASVHHVVLKRALDPVLKSYFGNNPNLTSIKWVKCCFSNYSTAGYSKYSWVVSS